MTRTGVTLPASWDPERDLFVWAGPLGPALPRGARVFVLAPGEVEHAPEGCRLVRTPAELFQALLALGGPPPKHAVLHRTNEVSPELQHELTETVRNGLRARAMQQKTVAESGVTWLLQGLANLPALAAHPSIAGLRGAFEGRPCVLVSPGPSLAKNVGALRELARSAVIVSGTHALSALARAGAAPHFVLCADPGNLSRHWAGLDLGSIEAFVVGATCRAETFAAPARRRFAFASNGALDGWLFEPLGETPGLATGGSVACSMLSFALHLGCDPVALVGQDLSFTERFYAEGGLDGDALVEPAGADEFVLLKPAGADGIGTRRSDGRLQFTVPQRVIEVPGWAGGRVRTTPQLKVFLDWFESVAPGLGRSTRFLNCTEGGAHIRGMEHLPLARASEGWSEPVEVASVLERLAAGFDAPQRRRVLRDWARRTLRALEECVALARRCRLLAARSEVHALAGVEKRLARALRGAPLVSLVAQDEIGRAREEARVARTLDENLAAARALYEVVDRAGGLLGEPLRTAARALA